MRSKLGSKSLILGIILGSFGLGIGFWREIGIITIVGMAVIAFSVVMGLGLPAEETSQSKSNTPTIPMPQVTLKDITAVAVPVGSFTLSAVILAAGFWLEIGILTIAGMLLVAASLVLGLQGPKDTSSSH
jgi:hypothetical protein